ncbi:MAG: alpha-ribazole phosphatase [Candidatus Kaiserbacteria bacterium]|nr:alpha-ribazole phosphatase [Candidatus Kaiserbacteria bacterium]
MKTIYLVRHGESVFNAGTHFEKKEAPLTAKGKLQVQATAKRLNAMTPQVIIASPLARTKETAEAIAKETGAAIEYTPLFAERAFPQEILGLKRDEESAMRIEDQWTRSLDGRAEWDGAGDTFEMLRDRADDAIEYLETRPEETIVLVTHGYFMRILLARVLFGAKMTREQFAPFAWGLRVGNASISKLVYDIEDDSHWSLWHLEFWSDCSHLENI